MNITVKEKLDNGYYLKCLQKGESDEMVRRKIVIDLMHEVDYNLSDESTIYAMFIWGEVVKQYHA